MYINFLNNVWIILETGFSSNFNFSIFDLNFFLKIFLIEPNSFIG